MTFSEKLISLMNLTSTTNIALAQGTGIDPPQVSRLRKGVRGMPRNSEIVRRVSAYFAGKCMSDYQFSALCELTGDVRLRTPRSVSGVSEILFRWLSEKETERGSEIGRFLQTFDKLSLINEEDKQSGARNEDREGEKREILAYYGNSGKRQAARDFLSYIETMVFPGVIQLASDEDPRWIIEDPDFLREITASIQQMVRKGFSIDRIQPPITNIDYAFQSASHWLPVYLTGSVRQYYYPWMRDNYHLRTIFVVPGQIALSSSSAGNCSESRITYLTTEKSAVDAITGEFADCLSLCKPMLTLCSSKPEEPFFKCMTDFEAIVSDGIYINNVLPELTMPPELLESVLIRAGNGLYAKSIRRYLKQRTALELEVLKNRSITDIICLADMDELKGGKVKIPAARLFPNWDLPYTPKEYACHLRQTVDRLERYPNYHLVLLDRLPLPAVIIYTKPGNLALLIKAAHPFVVMEVAESNMLAAFAEYLKQIACGAPHQNAEKESVINTINRFIVQLEE